MLAAGALAGHQELRGWEIVPVPEGEDYAANCIRVNDALLVARGFPATSALLGELAEIHREGDRIIAEDRAENPLLRIHRGCKLYLSRSKTVDSS